MQCEHGTELLNLDNLLRDPKSYSGVTEYMLWEGWQCLTQVFSGESSARHWFLRGSKRRSGGEFTALCNYGSEKWCVISYTGCSYHQNSLLLKPLRLMKRLGPAVMHFQTPMLKCSIILQQPEQWPSIPVGTKKGGWDEGRHLSQSGLERSSLWFGTISGFALPGCP